jgi:hypothetical protein
MTTPQLLARHLRDVHFGGNWTSVNLKEQLSDVTFQEAVTQIHSFNSILKLTYHIHYYVHTQLQVLQGGSLDAHDKFSFDHPPIGSEAEWREFVEKVLAEAAECAVAIEELPEETLHKDFAEPKYGTYHRNILGLIEHTHYHLGQIVILKKLLRGG